MKCVALLALAVLWGASGRAEPLASRPIDVVVGLSVAKVKIGMSLHAVTKLVHDLKPEGVQRGPDRAGYVSGPLLVVFDQASCVVSISVDLPRSRGLRVGKTMIPAEANLDRIKDLLPRCELANGSGGRVLECSGSTGKMHFYDSFSNPKAVWAILP